MRRVVKRSIPACTGSILVRIMAPYSFHVERWKNPPLFYSTIFPMILVDLITRLECETAPSCRRKSFCHRDQFLSRRRAFKSTAAPGRRAAWRRPEAMPGSRWDPVGDPVLLFESSGFDQPAGSLHAIQGEAQVDTARGRRLDLGEDMLAIDWNNRLARADLHGRAQPAGHLEDRLKDRPDPGRLPSNIAST